MSKSLNVRGIIIGIVLIFAIVINAATNNALFNVIGQILQISWALIKGIIQVLEAIFGFIIKILGL
jgi:hypothetical protein